MMMTVSTSDVIVEMLTEPTGRSILDSGDAYGRNWERNQGTGLADWEAHPVVSLDRWGGVTLSVFHYLRDRVEYVPDIDEAWQAWAQEVDPDDNRGWLDLADEYAQVMHNCDAWGELTEPRTWNTYNGEDFLSQVLQGVTFCHDSEGFGGEVYVLLQMHGGCDVRGGYTRPRVFRVCTDMAAYFPYDNADCEVWCTSDECGQGWQVRGGYDVYRNESGASDDLSLESNDEGFAPCPDCGAPLTVGGTYPC